MYLNYDFMNEAIFLESKLEDQAYLVCKIVDKGKFLDQPTKQQIMAVPLFDTTTSQ